MEYGRSFDPSKSLFDQLKALQSVTRHRTLSINHSENSEYCNNNICLKNCYLVFNSSWSEDCMYCERSIRTKDCIDCTESPSCELCYGCTACTHCYAIRSSEFCEDCSESSFLAFCRSCRNCFGCVNLRHREYCIWNEQKTKEEYEAFKQSLQRTSYRAQQALQERFAEWCMQHPRPGVIHRFSEHSTGNFLISVRNVENGFFVSDAEDCKHCFAVYEGAKDCREFSFFGLRAELLYECVQCGINDHHELFCLDCWENNSDLMYCMMCHGCKHCFGCVGLQKKHYCILNTQYTKDEYETLVPRIIEHMRTTGEWGEFYPIPFSSIPYNHSVAQRYFPLSQKNVGDVGGFWYEEHAANAIGGVDAAQLPDGLPTNDDPIIVKSAASGRPFKITSQEIKRYRQFAVPLPRMTYDERMEERAKKLGGVKLYERTCAKTGKPILTTYPPESPYILWDRDVYEKEFGS